MDIEGIFKNRIPNEKKIRDFGCEKRGNTYFLSVDLSEPQLKMYIKISEKGKVSFKVIDTDSEEEYILVNIVDSSGAYVGKIKQECEEVLKKIAKECFEPEVFKSEQAKQIIEYARNKYGDSLEFLWAKFPNNAVLRRKDTKMWYAAILTVANQKLLIDSFSGNMEGMSEVIDLRALPEDVEMLLNKEGYYPGYHMNKKHWYTIRLDGSISLQEIFMRIDESYILAR